MISAGYRLGKPEYIEQADTRIRRGQARLVVAEIANAHLHQSRHSGRFVQHIIHNGSVRIGKSFVSPAQVGMSVDMQYADARITLGHRADQSERDAMVAADQPHLFTGVQPPAGLVVHFRIEFCGTFVDPRDTAAHRFSGRTARFPVFDHPPSLFPQFFTAQFQRIADRQRPDSLPPTVRIVQVVQIDLQRSVQDCIGTAGRPLAVRSRHVPRNGHQHQSSLLRRKRKSEIAPVIHARSVRIKICFLHVFRN